MADLTASSTAPTVLFNDTSGPGVDWRLKLDPNDEFTLQRYAAVPAEYQTRLLVTNTSSTLSTSLTLSADLPTLTFSPTSGTAFNASVASSAFAIGSGGTSIVEVTTSAVKSKQNVEISQTTPTLTFTPISGTVYTASVDSGAFWISSGGVSIFEVETSYVKSRQPLTLYHTTPTLTFDAASGTDFTLTGGSSTFKIGSGGTSIVEVTTSSVKSKQNLEISQSTPTLSFTPSSGTAYTASANSSNIFAIGSGGNSIVEVTTTSVKSKQDVEISRSVPTLKFSPTSGAVFTASANSSSVFSIASSGTSILEVTTTSVKAKQSVTISHATPTLTFDDTDAEVDFRFTTYKPASFSNVFRMQQETSAGSGTFNSVLEVQDGYLYAQNGIASGHDYSAAGAHVLGWKRVTGTLGTSDDHLTEYSTYFVVRASDSQTGSDIKNRVLGVSFMMAPSGSSTYQVCDSQYPPSSPNGFYVEVILDASDPGDYIRVTYNPTNYGSTPKFRAVFWYGPA